jgi:hypothetical protein
MVILQSVYNDLEPESESALETFKNQLQEVMNEVFSGLINVLTKVSSVRQRQRSSMLLGIESPIQSLPT